MGFVLGYVGREDGTQTVDTGLKISIDSMTDDNCIITVSEK